MMRVEKCLCVTTHCLRLMVAKYDPDFVRTRKHHTVLMFIHRFLKRNRLSIRRITHRGRIKRSDLIVNILYDSISDEYLCVYCVYIMCIIVYL